MNNYLKYTLIAIGLIFMGCEKEEGAIEPYDRGDAVSQSVTMGTDYTKQIFYSLSNNQILSENNKYSWDLAFENTTDGLRIILNSAKKMSAADANATVLGSVNDVTNLDFNVDRINLEPDSLALYGWLDNAQNISNKVFVVNRGSNNVTAAELGYKKIQIIATDDNSYAIKWDDVNGNNPLEKVITKSGDAGYIYFSFENNGEIKNIEPPKDTWDFMFTQYIHIFYEPVYEEYLVTGIVINPDNVSVAKINKDYTEVSINDANTAVFTNDRDAIGYDWKFYDFDENSFVIVGGITYIVKDKDGFFYKLRFVDFYDDQGTKGTPQFEFIKL